MASFELPQTPQPRVSPALMVGVASPLWSYFAAAAAGGVAYWWMTQWTRPVNLEAMFGRARAMPGPALLLEPMAEAAEAVVETVAEAQAEVAEALLEEAPLAVGGESGPISPILEAAPAPEPEPMAEPEPVDEPEVMFAVAPEPVIDEPAPISADAAAEPAPKARTKKTASPSPETDA